MAVAMNAGGYFRSDFMISDAAIPMRLENLDELEAEQSAKFAEILSGFGAAESGAEIPDAVKEALEIIGGAEEEVVDEMLAAFVKAAYGEKAAAGSTEKSDVPQKKADDAVQDSTDGMMALKINPAIICNASEEMSAPVMQPETQEHYIGFSAVTENVRQEENSAAGPVQAAQDIGAARPAQQTAETGVIPTVSNQEGGTQVRTEKRDYFVGNAEKSARTEAAADHDAQVIAAVKTDNGAAAGEHSDRQYSGHGSENGGEFVQALGSEKAEVLAKAAENGEISKPQVTTYTAKHNAAESGNSNEDPVPEPAAAEQEAPAVQTTVRGRISSASDELEMLRTARSARRHEKTEPANGTDNMQAAQTIQPRTAAHTESRAPEVRQEEVVRQAAALVKTAVTENAADPEKTEYTLTLDPEDLGKITVKLSKAADGAVSVTVAAEKTATQRILEQNSAMLQDSLKSSGVRLESWQTVNGSRQENYAQDYNGSSKNPYYREETQRKPDEDDGSTFADLIAAM